MSRKNNVRDGSGAPAAGDVLNGSAASAAHAGAEGRAVRQSRGSLIRKWSRAVHRDLSFFFAGVIIIYAVSGICLNHKRDFNSNYSLKRYDIVLDGHFPMKAADTDRECLLSFVSQLPERESYTRHSATGETGVKIFFKGGSPKYELLKRWIAEGAPYATKGRASAEKLILEVVPELSVERAKESEGFFNAREGESFSVKTSAKFSDGSVRRVDANVSIEGKSVEKLKDALSQ